MNGKKHIPFFVMVFTIFFCAHPLQRYFDPALVHKKKLRVLVVAPHPDDEMIGCGGSIMRHTQQGNSVTIAYMTSGDAYAFGKWCELDDVRGRAAIGALREQEAVAGARCVGVSDLVFLRYHG